MILLSCDPGRQTGCCLLRDGAPSTCWTLKQVTPETVWQAMLMQRPWDVIMGLPDQVVIEIPESWTRKNAQGQSVNVREVLQVSAIAHVLYGWFIGLHLRNDQVRLVKGSEWKGQKSKKATAAELRLIATAEQWTVAPANAHERDALALGLWWWNRRKIVEI